jgi:hypothetical protein
MDANSGEPWSEADISDLKNELDHGRTIAKTASFLCRDVGEVPREDEGAWAGHAHGQAARRPLEQISPQRDQKNHHDRRGHACERDGTALFDAGHGTSSSFAHAFQASQLF